MVRNCLNCEYHSDELSNFEGKIFCIRRMSHFDTTYWCIKFHPERQDWDKEREIQSLTETYIRGRR